jgi:ketopantoate hydroxymethyltransferase
MKKSKKMAVGGLSSLVTEGEQSSVAIPGSTAGNVGAQNAVLQAASSFAPADNDFRPYSETTQGTAEATGQAMKNGGKATCKMSTGGKRSSKCPAW